MRKLSDIQISKVSESRKRHLSNWLHEWEIDSALRSIEDDAVSEGPQRGEVFQAAAGKGAVVEIEQIRLLYPDCRATWQRPLYLALLRRVGKNSFLAAPFSRFDNPALPGEWCTGREESQLRVLCLWNAAEFQSARLESGWQVDVLSRDEMSDALMVYDAECGRVALPENLRDDTGPPLIHPQDPRWEYREEELEFMESVMPNESPNQKRLRYELKEVSSEYLSKAAEEEEDLYGGRGEKG